METTLLFFTIIGSLVAFFTYLQKYVIEPEETKNRLLETFKLGRKVNNELIVELEKYVKEHHASQHIFMQGLTFQQGINELKKARSLLFTEQNEKNIKRANVNITHLNSLQEQIEDQILYHSQIKNHFNWFIKNE
ncbi:hypothetical protein [Rhodohalobacter sp. 614A]|uniref:hypothetical protein n=1 Tax=Rhodohalobacter sp. 614A TaxID=2908649 RepID=UPI001F2E44AA|nr:hypothetical protein [Rhodohalobacter sp. 614A]